jgi:hypothetical protein
MVLHVFDAVHFFFTNIQSDVGRCLPHMWGYKGNGCEDIFRGARETKALPVKPVFHGLTGRAA